MQTPHKGKVIGSNPIVSTKFIMNEIKCYHKNISYTGVFPFVECLKCGTEINSLTKEEYKFIPYDYTDLQIKSWKVIMTLKKVMSLML